MSIQLRTRSVCQAVFLVLLTLTCIRTWAAPFEIKVHDELGTQSGQSAYEIETNLFQAPANQNLKTNVLQARLEYAYGLTPQSELGLNLYLSRYNDTTYVNGGKVSHMYIPTQGESGLWHYGVKNEINYIQDIGGNTTTFYELTPIVALQLQRWRLTINPSVDVTLNQTSTVSFSPSAKIANNLTKHLDLGVEYYADNIPMKGFNRIAQQPNTAYLVMDAKVGKSVINFGVGKGVTASSDNWVVKFIASIDYD